MFICSKFSTLASKVIPVYHSSGSINHSAVNLACELIKKDGIVAVPTDTIYGLAGNIRKPQVINKIYQIKSRSLKKPLAICLAKLEDIYKWSKVTVSPQILQSLLPGPFTVLFERLPCFPQHINPDSRLIAFRIPDHNFIASLCTQLEEPLALTSANKSDEESCNEINQFFSIWPDIDAIMDGGKLNTDPDKLGSTIIDLSKEGSFQIIRDGCALNQARENLAKKFSLHEIKG